MTKIQANLNPIVLMVDDDDEDVYLTKRAFRAERTDIIFNSVSNCSELFDYFNRREQFSDLAEQELPKVILLDINIPRENGFEILERLRKDPHFGHIPVVMLTTSSAEKDIRQAYALGASSYLCKSIDAESMKKVAAQFCEYWFKFARIPSSI